MASKKKSTEELLLDWNLDRLDVEDRAELEDQLHNASELRELNLKLCKILAPLDQWTVSPTPTDLADKVLQKIKQDKLATTIPFEAAASTFASASPEIQSRARFVPMRDFIAAAACILLLVGVFIPGLSTMRSRSRQTACADNLGSIYRGTSTYQQAFAGSLPYAGRILGASWLPRPNQEIPFASNSRHTYLLVKHNYADTKDFICPCDLSAGPMDTKKVGGYDDFTSARNVSYDTINLSGLKPNLRPTKPVAYMSDLNPLFVGARFNAKVDPETANSPAHQGRGQTVLILDGSTQWLTTPYYGVQKDNLWMISNIRQYNGTESPIRDDDVQLVPGYPESTRSSNKRF